MIVRSVVLAVLLLLGSIASAHAQGGSYGGGEFPLGWNFFRANWCQYYVPPPHPITGAKETLLTFHALDLSGRAVGWFDTWEEALRTALASACTNGTLVAVHIEYWGWSSLVTYSF
jgi:hypothetical protein